MFQPVCSHRIRVNVPRTEHADEEHITYDTVLYEGLGDPMCSECIHGHGSHQARTQRLHGTWKRTEQ